MPDSMESRMARLEARGEARDEAIRDLRVTHESSIRELNLRLDKLDDGMEALAEKLGNAIVAAFEKATQQFASREMVTWWTGLLTRGLLWLLGLGLLALITGRSGMHIP